MTPEAQATETKINYWDYIKIKNWAAEERIHKMKRQLTEWEKYL